MRGNSGATDKNFVFSYDNTTGTGRPLSGTFIENDGVAEVTSFASFYGSNVDGISGAYGLVLPNDNTNGVRRIEQRDFQLERLLDVLLLMMMVYGLVEQTL